MGATESQVELRPVHKIVLEMLKDVIRVPFTVRVLAEIYVKGGVVPQEDIDELSEAFEGVACLLANAVHESMLEVVRKAVEAIRNQKNSDG